MRSRAHELRSSFRGGFTLLEVLLVLAVVVAITGLAWPALRGGYDASRLKTVGAEVRAAWIEARNQAMESGELRGFRCIRDGIKYQIYNLEAAENSAAATSGGAASALGPGTAPASSGAQGGQGEAQQIPEGYSFHPQADSSDRSSGMPGVLAAGSDLAGDAQWSKPIVFYPDGSSSDAELTITDKREQSITLYLRGTTGTSRSSEVRAKGEMLP